MKIKELKDKKIDDLKKLVSDKQEELRGFIFGGAGSRSKNVKLGRNLKKDIARIFTEMNLRKVEAPESPKTPKKAKTAKK